MRETSVGKIPWRRERLPTPLLWPGEVHGQSMGLQRVGHNWATFKRKKKTSSASQSFWRANQTAYSIWNAVFQCLANLAQLLALFLFFYWLTLILGVEIWSNRTQDVAILHFPICSPYNHFCWFHLILKSCFFLVSVPASSLTLQTQVWFLRYLRTVPGPTVSMLLSQEVR